MSTFIISVFTIPTIKLLWPIIDLKIQYQARKGVLKKIQEVSNDSKQQKFKEILIDLYNWMCAN